MTEITRILKAIDDGNPAASQELIPLVYDELRTLASRRMAHEQPGQTLQATALVHEAYLRLLGGGQKWENRAHFFGAAAEAMRRILIDNARRKKSRKHGGELVRVDLSSVDVAIRTDDEHLLLVNEALEKLEAEDPEAARLIKLRFFAGMSNEEAAETLGISVRSATRSWTYARAWLYREISRIQQLDRSPSAAGD
ncbi:MAG TPA: RNA polymerase subunit sigma [Verrucomicrobiales bacterium]|nr:RNA polymerase subunit sigma [Verrucomicrobiales bacterium]